MKGYRQTGLGCRSLTQCCGEVCVPVGEQASVLQTENPIAKYVSFSSVKGNRIQGHCRGQVRYGNTVRGDGWKC